MINLAREVEASRSTPTGSNNAYCALFEVCAVVQFGPKTKKLAYSPKSRKVTSSIREYIGRRHLCPVPLHFPGFL